jgi:oligosaccharide reducing-end xylanase
MILFLVLAVSSVSLCAADDPLQKRNLPAVTGPRFALADYQAWPANPGDAHAALWPDDRTGAVTLTIDDNWEADHPFWLSMQTAYGTTCTWFVITNNVMVWAIWKNILAKGHEVQSHTNSHLSAGTDSQFVVEYGGSQSIINRMVPAGRCLTLAYPGGTGNETIARRYFIAARGVYGVMNNANNTNYLNLNSGGENDTARIDILLDPAKKLYNTSYYRGWLSVHYHGVPDLHAATEKYLAYIYRHRDSLWVAGFSQAARYGQERDTHILTTLAVSDTLLRYTLADSMNDTLFNYPLTLKVRLRNDWQYVAATQNGAAIPCSLLTRQGNLYALVKAVPDQGEIRLAKAATSFVRPLPVRTGVLDLRDRRMYDLLGRSLGRDRRADSGIVLVHHEGRLEKRLVVR